MTDPYTAMSLRLQATFGLRREESIKVRPDWADRGDVLHLKASWAKGGRERDVPITNAMQRQVLEEAKTLAQSGSLIPTLMNYCDQKNRFVAQTARAGIYRVHGLRHAYAQRRYLELTRWKGAGSRRRSVQGSKHRAEDCGPRSTACHLTGVGTRARTGHSRLSWTLTSARPAPVGARVTDARVISMLDGALDAQKFPFCEISKNRNFGQNALVEEEFKTPGQLIEALLHERGWSQRILAAVLAVSESTLNKLISGKQAVSAEIAIALEEVLEVDAARFLALQQVYDLARARIVSRPNPVRVKRAQLFADFPVGELIQRRWINVDSVRDLDAVDAALMQFFEGQNPNEVATTPHAAKKTSAGEHPSPTQLAWLYRVRRIARELLVRPYDQAAAKAAIPKLKMLLSAPEEARHAPRILQECGIRLVIVEGLKSSKIDGVCTWLDQHTPVIGMTLRFDRMDNFWFVLRHELEHVLQGHGIREPALDVDIGTNVVDEEERIANAVASEFCAPKERIESFIKRKAPIFPERDFLGLSKILGVHPSLVAGQIQFKTGRYDLFRSHLVKIRDRVLPSAIVDGWGDVAPVGFQ